MKLSHLLVSVVACGALAGPAAAQEVKIGYVNLNEILSSPRARVSAAKIEKEFAKRRAELAQLASTLKTKVAEFEKVASQLTDTDRLKQQRALSDLDQDLNRKQRAFTDDRTQRENEERAVLDELITKTVLQISQAEKYDLVVTDALYCSARINLTAKVLKVLDKPNK